MILLITFRESKFRFWKNTSGFRSLYPWDESSHQTLSGDTDRQNQFKNGNNYYLMCFNILVVKIIISTFSFYDAFSPIIMKPYLILNIVFYTYYISIFWMQIHVCGHGRSNELRNLNREIMKIWKMRNPSIWLVDQRKFDQWNRLFAIQGYDRVLVFRDVCIINALTFIAEISAYYKHDEQ